MKKTLLTIAAILALASPAAIRAQITNTVTTQTHDPSFSMGRDFWFTYMANEWGENLGGAYLAVYVTSTTNGGEAFIQYGSHLVSVGASSNYVSAYYIPLSWEMVSSGIVENKTVHVWSNDADLVVCAMNRNSASADGEYIIPTIGWGTDYVVAAYGSEYDGFGTFGADLPSTMAIVANEDSTSVAITPSCDCRQDSSATSGNSSQVAFPAGKTFTIMLNRGESFQLIPIFFEGPPFLDLTGTIVHSNKPIGVLGGSMCTNIPAYFPYCDHVEDMLPPVRTWGETYYSANFHQPRGVPGNHDSAMYLFIASKPNQTIYRQECTNAPDTECIIPAQYGIYWAEATGPQKFFSDTPFLLVEYGNSETYPTDTGAVGAPAEAHINPRETFTKTVTFETPVVTGAQYPDPYSNYVNITVNKRDAQKIRLDGKPIPFSPQCLDSNWEFFGDTSIEPGSHTITGDDSGVGVNVYGYGYDEAYEWSSPSFEGTLQSPDTTAPSVDTMTACNQAFIHLSDSGLLPDSIHTQSGISEIEMDSDYNMDFLFNLNFIAGIGVDTTSYAMSVEDITKPAYLRVNVFDMAGNKTVITSTYKSMYDSITPYIHDLGGWEGGASNIGYDTIFNKGEVPFPLDELHLTNDSAGFVIFDSIGGPPNLSPIPVGNRRIIQIQLDSISQYETVDTILAGNSCDSVRAILTGFGGISNFIVSNGEWEEMLPAPDTGYVRGVRIVNYLPHSLTIDSARWSDTTHFKAITKLPLNVSAAPGQSIFEIAYFPDLNSLLHQDATQGSWYSHNVLQSDGVTPSPRYDSLIGWALAPSGVQNSYSPSLQASIIPTNNGRSLEIILPTNLTAPAHFELVNVLGQNVLGTTLGTQIETIDASALPRGVYFYRITLGSMNQMGKVILGQ